MITFVGPATLVGVASPTPTIDLTLPALAADDIIIVAVMSKNIVEATNEIATPTDFIEKGSKIELDATLTANDMRSALFYKRAGGAESVVTISRAGNSSLGLYAIGYVFRGCTPSGDPFDAAGIATNVGDDVDDTDIDFPAFDPAPDRHVVYFAWHADDLTSTPPDIVNGGFTFTVRDEQETSIGTDATAMLWSADHDGTPLGAITQSITSPAGTSFGYVFGLIPGVAGPPPPDPYLKVEFR